MPNHSSDVRTAWQSAVFEHATVAAVTDKVYAYDVSVESDLDAARLRYEGTINFFLYKVTRLHEPLAFGTTRYTFTVQVEYYLQQTDASASTFNTLVDRLEVVDDLVRSELGGTWGNTVDYYQGGRPSPVTSVRIDNLACWRGAYTYTGIKTV